MIKKDNIDIPLRSRQISEVWGIPGYLVGGPLVGFWLGGWLDQQFDSIPYLRIILMILGVVSGMRESWRIVRQIADVNDKN